jgi:hypothetical protein
VIHLPQLDEVHIQELVLEEAQDPQASAEQELVAVAEENVPNSRGHVQGQRLQRIQKQFTVGHSELIMTQGIEYVGRLGEALNIHICSHF